MKITALILLTTTLAFSQETADSKTRQRTVRDLARGGQDSIPQIAPYLKDRDLSVRIEAVKVLVEISGPKTVDPLLAMLSE